jgi:hypothetical protein
VTIVQGICTSLFTLLTLFTPLLISREIIHYTGTGTVDQKPSYYKVVIIIVLKPWPLPLFTLYNPIGNRQLTTLSHYHHLSLVKQILLHSTAYITAHNPYHRQDQRGQSAANSIEPSRNKIVLATFSPIIRDTTGLTLHIYHSPQLPFPLISTRCSLT